jgi:hypothetical protein
MHFQIFDANILINLAPLDSQSRILAPPPRDAPRARITTQKFLVCVFCRRDLLSHTAPPKPPRSRPPEPVPEWEPNPDYPNLTLITRVIAIPQMTLMILITSRPRRTAKVKAIRIIGARLGAAQEA